MERKKKLGQAIILLLLFLAIALFINFPQVFVGVLIPEDQAVMIRYNNNVMEEKWFFFALFGTVAVVNLLHKKKIDFFKSSVYDFGRKFANPWVVAAYFLVAIGVTLYSYGNYEMASLEQFTVKKLFEPEKVYHYQDIEKVKVYIDKKARPYGPGVIYEVVFTDGNSVKLGANTGATVDKSGKHIGEVDIDKKIKGMGLPKEIDKTDLEDTLNGVDEGQTVEDDEYNRWILTLFDERAAE